MNLAPDIFASFLPRILRQRVVRESGEERRPKATSTPVAAVFADLSGFTKLTVELSKQGRRGSEQVSTIVGASFDALTSAVQAYGGDVLTLSGDAVLAIWPVEQHESMAVACHRAAACALACVSAVDAVPDIGGRRLGVKVLLSAGNARLMDVGGLDDRWLFLAAGEAMRGLGAVGSLPKRGQVVAHTSAWSHLEGVAVADRLGEGWLIDSVSPVSATPTPPTSASVDDLPALRPWLAPPVTHVLDAGRPEWAAELRRISVLFVNIPRIDLSGGRELAALNRAIVMLQAKLKHYEGAFQDLVQDDKGLILMASWGVPPFSHENDALRAVLAALGMQEALQALKLEHTIGVATGDVYSGFYGNDNRRQHAVVGAAVNRAARLMQAAQGGLLCDPETARLAGDRVRFSPQQPIRLKGFPEPVAPLRPLWAEQRTSPVLHSRRDGADTVVGRDAERQVLRERVASLAVDGMSATVVVVGEAGIGKSMLAAELLKATQDVNVRALVGIGDDVERHQPWFALRPILEDLLDLQHVVDPTERHDVVLERLTGEAELLEWVPLLNDVLPLGISDNNTTRMMSGAMRSDALTDLALHLLRQAAQTAPILLLADDAHWIDSASFRVFLAARQQVEPLLFVAMTRPESGVDALEQLAGATDATTLSLAALSDTHTEAFVCHCLGAQRIERHLLQLVRERTEGNPLFVEEFALALRETGVVEVRDGQAELTSTSTEMQILARDGTLGAIITTRLDRMPAPVQQLLKVASVLGRSASRDALQALLSDGVSVDDGMRQAVQADLMRVTEDQSEWAFRHALIQEAAYMLATFAQRTALHAKAAAFFRQEMEDEHFGGLGLLAHHLLRAEQFGEGLAYLERAAEEALNTGANVEALQFIERAQQTVIDHPEAARSEEDQARRARWAKITGNARLSLGDLDGADADLRQSLSLLQVDMPTSGVGLGLSIARNALAQAVHLLGLTRRASDAAVVQNLAEAARVSSLLSQVRYFHTDIPGWLHACLTSLNLAERAGVPQAAGRAYGGIGNLVGTLGLGRLSRRYFTRAEQAESAGGLLTRYWAESVVTLCAADWETTRLLVDEGLGHAARVGHRYEEGIGMTIKSYADLLQGDLAASVTGFNAVLGSARQRGNPQHEGWALTLMIPALVSMHSVEDALSMSDQADERIALSDPLSVPIHHGTRALALHHAGRHEQALASAKEALTLFSSANPVYTYIPGLVGMLDVLLAHWEMARASGAADLPARRADAKAGLKALVGFARLFTIAGPYVALYRGLVADAEGKSSAALKHLRHAADSAKALGLPRAEARARHALFSRLSGEQADAQCQAARALYGAMNASYDLEQLESSAG